MITKDILELKIFGHSQGAALAVLCAVDLEYHFPDKDYEVILFGSPRIGNHAFRTSYNKRLFKTLRIENGNDIVTKIPFSFMGYRHVGMGIPIGKRKIPCLLSFKDHYPQSYYKNILKLTH
jgi:predicted lipase